MKKHNFLIIGYAAILAICGGCQQSLNHNADNTMATVLLNRLPYTADHCEAYLDTAAHRLRVEIQLGEAGKLTIEIFKFDGVGRYASANDESGNAIAAAEFVTLKNNAEIVYQAVDAAGFVEINAFDAQRHRLSGAFAFTLVTQDEAEMPFVSFEEGTFANAEVFFAPDTSK